MWSEIVSLRKHRNGPLEPDPVDTGVGKGTVSYLVKPAPPLPVVHWVSF